MKLVDDRLIEFIKSKHQEPNFDLERFLNPTENDLKDANLFGDIDKITSKSVLFSENGTGCQARCKKSLTFTKFSSGNPFWSTK